MRDAGRKHEIRKARDLIKVRLIFRRKRFYKHKITPNEIKNKNVIIILEKVFIRASEIFLNISLNIRKTLRKYFRNE